MDELKILLRNGRSKVRSETFEISDSDFSLKSGGPGLAPSLIYLEHNCRERRLVSLFVFISYGSRSVSVVLSLG